MKCFQHPTQEAIAACKKCGKGMCADCSSYTGHSGICPSCKKDEFKKEVSQLYLQIDDEKKSKFWTIFYTVLTCWLIIPIFVCIYKVVQTNKSIEKKENRVFYLNNEIKKIEAAQRKGSGSI